MRRFVIGTAGHVDHGKTALVRALTGVDTDRLPEEKRRGISIELGFARLRLEDDIDATVIDVPGHRRLVHTMIAGASGIELMLLVIAANEGVMPQTREHVHVCEDLGVRHAVVVLTKSDLVDAETLEMATEEARELLASRFDMEIASCSVRGDRGIADVRSALVRSLRRIVRPPPDRAARLWVDRVLRLRGAGTVVTGTLVTGSVSAGDELLLIDGTSARVVTARELRIHADVVEAAEAPTRLAVNLSLVGKSPARGDLLTSDRTTRTTGCVDARFRGVRLKRGAALAMHVGSTRVAVRVTRVDPLPGTEQLLRLKLSAPTPIEGGARYVLRGTATDSSRGSLAGGGTVIDARPHPRSTGTRRTAFIQAVLDRDARATLTSLLAEVRPAALDLSTLGGRLDLDVNALVALAKAQIARGDLLACAGGVVERLTVTELADEARRLVSEHVARAPLDRGLPLATLRQKLAARCGVGVAEAAILSARARRSPDDFEAIAIESDVAVPATRSSSMSPALSRAAEEAEGALLAAGVHGLTIARLMECAGSQRDQTRALLATLERQGKVVLAGDLWFASRTVDELEARVRAHFEDHAVLTVATFKELGGLPRKQAVLLLEHLDGKGMMKRVGDVRELLRGSRGQ